MSGKRSGKNVTIIRRDDAEEPAFHGGAWKVAYADFVTAMMAFFLLMWLLNATTEEQRLGLADYFSPINALARGASGAGQPFGGKTPFETGTLVSDRGSMSVVPDHANETIETGELIREVSIAQVIRPTMDEEPEFSTDPQGDQKQLRPTPQQTAGAGLSPRPGQEGVGQERVGKERASPLSARERLPPDARALALVGPKTQTAAALGARALVDEQAIMAEAERRQSARFEEAANQIRIAVKGDKLLEDLSRQLAIDQTPDGLRIQLLDEDRKPMFATGSSLLQDRARVLLAKVAPVLAGLPEAIAISGHTDNAQYRGREKSNWELSSERALATRRLLVEAGLPEQRFRRIAGVADRDPLLPADPAAAANRRIAIMVLRQSPGGGGSAPNAAAPALASRTAISTPSGKPAQ